MGGCYALSSEEVSSDSVKFDECSSSILTVNSLVEIADPV